MNLHYFITLMILPIGTSGYNEIQYIRYTSEYIPKLQIHKHSLLTRKVFSWHSSSTQVFIIGSSSKLDHHHHWIIIKVGSSSSLDHHQTGSSSKLDHHCSLYLKKMVISLNSTHHRKFYRANPFSCWMYISTLISDHGSPSLPPC